MRVSIEAKRQEAKGSGKDKALRSDSGALATVCLQCVSGARRRYGDLHIADLFLLMEYARYTLYVTGATEGF